MAEELLIDQVTDVTHGMYQPYGWHHWPKYPWMSYQFRRALGETQEGGKAVQCRATAVLFGVSVASVVKWS